MKRVVRNWIKEDENVDIIVAIVRVVLIIAMLMSVSSCGAQYHLNRAIKKDASIVNDTIVRLDTAFVTEEKIVNDTIVVHDTIVQEIRSEGVVVRIQKIHDTLRVEAICESDTIEIVKEVEVVRLIQEQKRTIFEEMRLAIRSLIALIVSALLFIVLSRIVKY